MPELPEVEHTRGLLERRAVGRTIVEVHAAKDDKIFPELDPESLASTLRGRRISAAERHGKWAWLTFDRGPALLVHLGMTGAIRYPGDTPLALESSPAVVDRSWPPRFVKLRLVLDDETEIAMTDPRRLGRILLRDAPRTTAPIAALGFDPLTSMPSKKDFAEKLARRRGNLKGVLLDQTFAAGVGNWIADEVLYQARLDPRRTVSSLTPNEVSALHTSLRNVITVAVRADARKESLPPRWLFHHRWGKNVEAKTAAGERIEHLVVAGRTTAWVPGRQK